MYLYYRDFTYCMHEPTQFSSMANTFMCVFLNHSIHQYVLPISEVGIGI